MFLTQTTPLDRGGGAGFAISVLAKMTGVGQVILECFSEPIIQAGLMPLGQVARDKYERYSERRGKGFRGEYQSNTQVPEKFDVGSSVNHVAQ